MTDIFGREGLVGHITAESARRLGKTQALIDHMAQMNRDAPVMIPNVPYLVTAAKEGGLDYRLIEDLTPMKSLAQQQTEQAFETIMREVEKRLLALPPGWRVATTVNEPKWGDETAWRHVVPWALIDLEPGAPSPAPGKWTIYGPLTDEQRNVLASRA